MAHLPFLKCRNIQKHFNLPAVCSEGILHLPSAADTSNTVQSVLLLYFVTARSWIQLASVKCRENTCPLWLLVSTLPSVAILSWAARCLAPSERADSHQQCGVLVQSLLQVWGFSVENLNISSWYELKTQQSDPLGINNGLLEYWFSFNWFIGGPLGDWMHQQRMCSSFGEPLNTPTLVVAPGSSTLVALYLKDCSGHWDSYLEVYQGHKDSGSVHSGWAGRGWP